jgi:predicted Ser/Thr protein kinase
LASELQATLGRYRVEAEIGRGAMGVVYRGFDPKIDRSVAIKTISLAGLEGEAEQQYRHRFLQEARAAGRLSHPGIVTIYDAAEDPETREPYIVMEFVHGEPLSKLMSGSNQKLPLRAALQFAEEIAEALDYAHSQGVVHRDIKPANILITPEGHTKIADFGVARLNQELMSQPGQVVGSPAYMSPEQMNGEEADERSDLFSLGVVLYSMITGFRPFQGNSARTVCFKVMNVEPVPVSTFEHDVPPQLNELISRAIAKDPADRYQSGAAMARAIRSLRTAEGSAGNETLFFERALKGYNLARMHGSSETHQGGHHSSTRKYLLAAAVLLAGVFAMSAKTLRPLAQLSAAELKWPPPSVPQNLKALSARLVIRKPRPQPVAVKVDSPEVPRVVPSPPVPDLTLARMQVEIEHHFPFAARASIWIDDKLMFEQQLRSVSASARHPIFRAVEMNQVSTLEVTPGKHQLQVRIVSNTANYDQVQTLELEVAPATLRVLHVNCDNHRKMEVMLE